MRLYLVRHGKAAADWSSDHDPGLDELGHAQAKEMAARLVAAGPLPLITSPLRRTRETAAALERVWGMPARIEPRVGEIPSPTPDLAARAKWLKGVMQKTWSQLDEPLRTWRQAVLQALLDLDADTVVVSHFVAINVVVGYARGDDRVICFQPDNASCTELEVSERRFTVTALGREASTRVI